MNAGARRVCRWLLALPLLLVGVAGVLAAAEPDLPLTLSAATFENEDNAPREVALPHTWALDGLPASGKGRYRIVFELGERPELPWALAASRLVSRHAIRLNGALVHGTLAADGNRSGVPVPVLVDLPPALLRAGANRLDRDPRHKRRARPWQQAAQEEVTGGAAQ